MTSGHADELLAPGPGREGPDPHVRSADGPALRTCRFCGSALSAPLVDLGTSPLANSYLAPHELARPEVHYPLGLFVCERCYLVQLPAYEEPDRIFGDYAYFSSYSESWLEHARAYVETMVDRFGIDSDRRVIEVASNDGYLLQYFKARGVPVLGVEPAANVAKVAEAAGIPTAVRFFGAETASELRAAGERADLLVANNVLAHVPDINDFVEGIRILLEDGGLATVEVHDVLRLIQRTEFDTIYHEHFTYFSLLTLDQLFEAHGLRVFDVEELPTHGGSLRAYVCHRDSTAYADTEFLHGIREREASARLRDLATYARFQRRVTGIKQSLLGFLVDAWRNGRDVVAYGAPAKGNTLLNYCGVRADLIKYTVDRNPHKQDHYLPGSRIPILGPERIDETRPDYLLILPWNLKDEIIEQMQGIRIWGGRFVLPIPEVQILD